MTQSPRTATKGSRKMAKTSSKTAQAPTRAPWQRMLALLIGLVAGLGALFGIGAAAWAEDDKNDLSLYSVSSSVTGYFASALKPGEEREISDGWQALADQPATGGAFMGYADRDLNPVEWLVEQATSSSQAIEFGSLNKIGDGVRHYAEFGATLSQLGLDSTATGLSSNLMGWIGGALLLGPFMIASAVNWTFSWALQALQFLNPFKLLFEGVAAVSPAFADAVLAGEMSPELGPLAGLANFIGGIYQAINNLSWAVLIPVFIAVTAFVLIFSKSRGSVVKKLIVRVVFIVLGIPLLGGMYTSILTQLGDATDGVDSGATQVVASTFVDFEKWAGDYRLAVPADATIEWDTKSAQPTTASVVQVQDTALAINQMTHPEWEDLSNPFSLNSPGTFASGSMSADGNTQEGMLSAIAMITRFMDGEQFTSSTYASKVQSIVTKDGDGTEAAKWFTDLRTDGGGWFGIGASDPGSADVSGNKLLTVDGSYGLRADTSGEVVSFSTAGSEGSWKCGADPRKQSCSMSVLSTYNYLNTAFDSNSLTTYSTNKVASSATAEAHNSVTLVGTGFGSLVYWFNAFVLLMSFVVIGIGYAIAMFIGNIKAGLQVLTATPFAMLGALSAITKVIVFAIAMILELLVTIFLYKLVQQVLLSLPQIFSFILGQMGVVAAAQFMAAPGLALVIPLFVAIILIGFTIIALRVRKSVVRAITEACTKLVELLTGSGSPDVPGAGKAGVLAAAAGGIGAGAGMALGGRMMGGDKAPKGSDGGGPESVSASGTVDAGSVSGGGAGTDPSGSGSGGGGAITGGPGGPGVGGVGGTSDSGAGSGGGLGSGNEVDVEVGERVARSGLTALPAGSSDGQDGQKSLDVVDTAVEAGQAHNAAQKGIDRQKRGAVKDGAAGVGKVATAAGRAYAGDAVGAVSDAQGVAGSAGKAASKAQSAKQAQRNLDRGAASRPATQPKQPTQPRETQLKTQSQPKSAALQVAPKPAPRAAAPKKPSLAPSGPRSSSGKPASPRPPKRSLPIDGSGIGS